MRSVQCKRGADYGVVNRARIATVLAGIPVGLVVVALTLTNLARSTDIAGLRGTMLPGVEVVTFAHPEKLLPVRVVPRGKSSQPLPKALKPFPSTIFRKRSGHRPAWSMTPPGG
jgi:hypothetical protein